jgi:hypothetical protein
MSPVSHPLGFRVFQFLYAGDSPNCVLPNVSSVPQKGSGTLNVRPFMAWCTQSYPYLIGGVTGIIGMYGIPHQGTPGLADGLLLCTEAETILAEGCSLRVD